MSGCNTYALYNHWDSIGQAEGRQFGCTHKCNRANFNILNLAQRGALEFNMCIAHGLEFRPSASSFPPVTRSRIAE